MKMKRSASVIQFPPQQKKRSPPETPEGVYEEYSSHAILLAASWYILNDEGAKAYSLLNAFMEDQEVWKWTWLPDELAALVEEAEDYFFDAYLGKKLESSDD